MSDEFERSVRDDLTRTIHALRDDLARVTAERDELQRRIGGVKQIEDSEDRNLGYATGYNRCLVRVKALLAPPKATAEQHSSACTSRRDHRRLEMTRYEYVQWQIAHYESVALALERLEAEGFEIFHIGGCGQSTMIIGRKPKEQP